METSLNTDFLPILNTNRYGDDLDYQPCTSPSLSPPTTHVLHISPEPPETSHVSSHHNFVGTNFEILFQNLLMDLSNIPVHHCDAFTPPTHISLGSRQNVTTCHKGGP